MMRAPALATLADLQGPERQAAVHAALQRVQDEGVHTVRVVWGDLHGTYRSKSLITQGGAAPLAAAFEEGVGLVSTLLMKDTSDRTAFKVFEPGAVAAMAGLQGANNLFLLPDPSTLTTLPWAPHTAWVRADALTAAGAAVAIDPRQVLQRALALLQQRGWQLRCGLEVEFHIHRIVDARLAAEDADWPAEPPRVSLLHPGYKLLSDNWADMADEALAIVRDTACGLRLPLRSLEVELGPSQFEAVFDAVDALTAADQMLMLRNGLRQALRRAGYHASFVCRPPLPNSIASGWHLHQSVVDAEGGNVFAGGEGRATSGQARHTLSDTGAHWLAGLLHHARGMTALCAPTLLAYGRYQGSVMAPQAAVWGFDNRGAMLRVVGGPGDAATRIENRVGEPLANPYLYMAAQVFAGLDGVDRRLEPGAATASPYETGLPGLPSTLGEALDALADDAVMQDGLGAPMARLFNTIKRQEAARAAAAEDLPAWLRREYFGRY